MNIICNHSHWKACLHTCTTALDSNKYKGGQLQRWKPYADLGLIDCPISAEHHLHAASEVAQILCDSIHQGSGYFDFDRDQVMEKVSKHSTANTRCFDEHDLHTSKDDLIYGAVERVTVLCFALAQYRRLVQAGHEKAPQILVDTLNLEVMYLNRLSGCVIPFRNEFWNEEISKACGEYIADFADQFPHISLSEQEAKKNGVKVLDTEQLQISPVLL